MISGFPALTGEEERFQEKKQEEERFQAKKKKKRDFRPFNHPISCPLLKFLGFHNHSSCSTNMADSTPSPSSNQTQNASLTTITDLDVDSLAHSAAYLHPRDVCNLAMTCRFLKRVAYSDSIWQRFFREHWQQNPSSSSLLSCGMREMYLARRTAVHQFKFADPFVADFHTDVEDFKHLQLCNNEIFITQGSQIQMINLDRYHSGEDFASTLTDHKARITSMRLFSIDDIPLFRGKTKREDKVVVTSSCDHSIRLWWKGSSQRCFRGHCGPVLSLSNKLLGEDNSKILASGGDDGTVRLWSLNSSGKRGQQALKATLYGHEKPVDLMLVAGHKTSLLATVSRDSKVRVWDTATSSAVRSSCCVGMTSIPGAPIKMKCHESLLYIASSSLVTAVDLRTMRKVITAGVRVRHPKIHSFDIVPSKSLFCTGGNGRAFLWDIRSNQQEPIADLDGHWGPVTELHMDPYKIVSGGPGDIYLHVWEVDTGAQTNSLYCCCTKKDGHSIRSGCGPMAVDGGRIATVCYCVEKGILRFRDFNNGASPVMKLEDERRSKFWDLLDPSPPPSPSPIF